MPFVHEYAPISSILALGGIAGAGSGIAQAKAKQLQDQQLSAQIAAQNAERAQQAEQAYNQQAAQEQANSIQNALAYAKLNQEQNQFNAEQEQRKAQEAAQQLMAQTQQAESTRRFNEQQKLGQAEQTFKEKQYNQGQTEKAQQETAVNQMIDQLYPVASNPTMNQRMKLQFKATGRLPAPESSSDARNLNALKLVRTTLIDPITGTPLPGKEQDLANLDNQISAIVQGLGSGAVQEAAPVASSSPVTQGMQPTGQVSSEGLPIVKVSVQGQPHLYPLVKSQDEYARIPAGEHYVLPNGQIFIKK